MNDTHVPDPGPTDLTQWGAWTKRGKQERFLKEYEDLISPWIFPLPVRIQMGMGRLVRGWQAAAEKAKQA